MSFHTIRASYNDPSVGQLQQRRVVLKGLLKQQVRIATTLSSTEGHISQATRHAWDVVEELTVKLNRIEDAIQAEMQHFDRTLSFTYDEELSSREYEM